MNRQVRWTSLITRVILTFGGAIAMNRYAFHDNWHKTLHVCLFEIPVFLGIGYYAHRKAMRRATATLPPQ